MEIRFWIVKLLIGAAFLWGWQRRNSNEGILIDGIWWGQFWNNCLYKGIDGICQWLGSFLSNHLTCTYGIFCLDMIFYEIIQIENPRHVIDAMSSMKLILKFWSFGVSLWFVGFCILCRKLLHWMKMD